MGLLSEIEQVLGLSVSAMLPEIEDFLVEQLPGGNDALDQPAKRILDAGGKRLRPILVASVARTAGLDEVTIDVLRCCAAVEYLHVGSLVHDDSLDDALTRRGVPTVNAVEGWKQSILVGDYILGRAGQVAAAVNQDVAAAIADAIVALTIGQSLEEATLFDPNRSEAVMMAAIGGKTAALLEASCRVGAICAALPIEDREAVARFGYEFGLAFQLIDDVLDWVSTEELVGKPVRNDVASGVYTLPFIYAKGQGCDFGYLPTDGSVPSGETIEQVTRDIVAADGIRKTVAVADEHASLAAGHLEPLVDRHPGMEKLIALPRFYNSWALANLVSPEMTSTI